MINFFFFYVCICNFFIPFSRIFKLTDEKLAAAEPVYQQMNLFTDYLKSEVSEAEQKAEKEKQEKERKLQEAMLSVKKKFGKNAILKGSSLQEGSTTIERNNQIGGHRA